MALAYKMLAMVVQAVLAVPSGSEFRVIDAVSGSDAETPIHGVRMAQNVSQWSQIWMAIQGDAVTVTGANGRPTVATKPMPRVDFDRNVVVGVFGGATSRISGYEVVDFDGQDERAVVRLRPVVERRSVAVLTHAPYLVMILPRTKKEVEIQMMVSAQGQPRFRTIATLPKTIAEKQ